MLIAATDAHAPFRFRRRDRCRDELRTLEIRARRRVPVFRTPPTRRGCNEAANRRGENPGQRDKEARCLDSVLEREKCVSARRYARHATGIALRSWGVGLQPTTSDRPLVAGSDVRPRAAVPVFEASGLARVRPAARNVKIDEIPSRTIDAGFEGLSEAGIRREDERHERKHDRSAERSHLTPPLVFRRRAPACLVSRLAWRLSISPAFEH